MKWIALALLIAAIPLLTVWLRTSPRQAPWLWSFLTFLPFVNGPWHLGIAPYAIPMWSGYVKGWEITLLDSVAIAILLGTRGRWPRLYLLIPLLLYVVAVFIAVFQARFGNYAFAYVVQLARVVVVFVAVARVMHLDDGQRAILRGLVVGLCVQAGYALWARAGGALQTGGSLGHQNLLGFLSHMAVMPAFAMFLAGKWPRLSLAGVLAGIIVVVLTASRATIAFSGLGLALTFVIAMSVGFSARKAAIGVAGVAVLLAAVPLAQASLDRRFEAKDQTFFQEDLERVAFEKAAHQMIADHPMGVGPNHYVFMSNTEGYSDRAGVYWGTGSRSTSVHNTYLLVQAETGYFGLATFLLLLISIIYQAFRTTFRYSKMQGAEMLIGVGTALIAMSLHAFVEWTFVVEPTQYLLGAMLGIIAGLRSRYEAMAPRRIAPPTKQMPSTAPALSN